jgi:hypothetical protein
MSSTLQTVDILAHMTILFNLKMLDVLFLYYYYSQTLDKSKYYSYVLLYLAHELNELARARNEPSQADFLAWAQLVILTSQNEPSRAEPSQASCSLSSIAY